MRKLIKKSCTNTSLLLVLLITCVTTPVWAQEVGDNTSPTVAQSTPDITKDTTIQAKVTYEVTGAKGARIFEDRLLVDEVSKLSFTPIGFVRVTTDAVNIAYEVTNSKRESVDYKKLAPNVIEIRESGKIWVEVTVIDFAKNIYANKTTVLEIGKAPDAPDKPNNPDEPDQPDNPDIDPNGPFNGLASRISKLKSQIQIDKRNQLVTVFEYVARQMQTYQFRQQAQAVDHIVKNRPSAAGDVGLTALYTLLAEDSAKRQLSWQEIQDYYREIVKGLR